MFKIIVEKHINCTMVRDLWKIERSVISQVPWWPCFLADKICLAIFVEGHDYSDYFCKSFLILIIGFKGEDI